jgi:SagB-type dehydrogenase family enzyme
MADRATQLRRAKSLIAYWEDGRLFFRNFGNRYTVSGRPVTCEVLDFFDDWRTPRQAVSHFADYTPKSVRSAVSQLKKRLLLLVKGSPAAVKDARIAKEWAQWLPEGSFHFSTKDALYVRNRSRVRWLKSRLPKTPPPNFFKSVKGAKKAALPARAFPSSEFVDVLMQRRTHREFLGRKISIQAVSQLLSLVWGVTGYLESPIFGRLPHKTSPSGGARHPGEVYLVALRVKGLRPGIYHYHSGGHYLELITTKVTRNTVWRYCAGQDYVKNVAALFLMTAVFPRTMWKYNHVRAYRVVLLETGHLCQTFCLVATWLGLAPFCTGALADTLIEKDLGIDGIRESVLYAAGVGLPVNSQSVRPLAQATSQFFRNGDHRAKSPNKDVT